MNSSLGPRIVVNRETWPDREISSARGSAFEASEASSPIYLLSSCVALGGSLKLSEADLQFVT